MLGEEEEKIFHNNFGEHGKKEGALAKVEAWLGTFGSLLQGKLPGSCWKRLERSAKRGHQQPAMLADAFAALAKLLAGSCGAMERRAAKSGESNKKDLEKAATKLLTKKTTKTDPNYKPRKASGLTTKERKALYKKGERTLRDIRLKNLGKNKESELKHPISSSGYKGYKKK